MENTKGPYAAKTSCEERKVKFNLENAEKNRMPGTKQPDRSLQEHSADTFYLTSTFRGRS